MIPGDIVAIDDFPVNANHKIDKNKLIELYKTL
jgi:D-alanine--poly(phosphoribitol) ligase subunit 1